MLIRFCTAAILLMLLTLPLSAQQHGAVSQAERDALIALYNSTDGPHWTRADNWLGPPGTEWTWYGVGCETRGEEDKWGRKAVVTVVTKIELPGNNLTGTLPAELGVLNQIWWLDLSDNHLSGGIPAQIGNITELSMLSLENNPLGGSLPTSLGNLTRLWALILANCELEGSIPVSLGNLREMLDLNLWHNNLSGTIPSSLGNMTKLWYLRLHENQLEGPIPDSLTHLRDLIELTLGRNELSGPIPTGFGGCPDMEVFSLEANALSGQIPADLGNLPSLRALWLSENQLSGPIPPELGNLSHLDTLTLRDNGLDGTIPDSLGDLSNLVYFSLERNALDGDLPTSLGNLASLQRLSVAGNRLTGPLPASLMNLSHLQVSTDYDAGLRLEFNAFHTDDAALRDFINARQYQGDFESSQTVAPGDLQAEQILNTSVTLKWTPIDFWWGDGGYRILAAESPGGPYTQMGTTATKSDSELTITGLTSGTTYYFVMATESGPHGQNPNTVISEYGPELEVSTANLADRIITASAGEGGHISPAGAVPVQYGGSQTFLVTADPDYHIDTLRVDGSSVGTVTSYTFRNVITDHTIEARFAAGPPVMHVITATARRGGRISPSGTMRVPAGSRPTFSFTADTGYAIWGYWLNDVYFADQSAYMWTSMTASLNNVQADTTLEAVFNRLPVAVEDLAVTPVDTAVVIMAAANDWDGDGDPLQVESVAAGAHGTTAIEAGGVRYTPQTGFSGLDSFIYTLWDGINGRTTGVVRVMVGMANTPPQADDVTVTTREDTPVSGTLSASDPDGGAITYAIAANGQLGTATILDSTAGTFVYRPRPFAGGTDVFTYYAIDGDGARVAGTVTVTIIPFATHLYGAHMAGADPWWTRLNLVNTGDTAAPVFLHAFDAVSGAMLESVALDDISAGGTIQVDVGSVFSADTLAHDAWIRASADMSLAGVLSFGTTDSQTWVTIPLQEAGMATLVFPFVYVSDIWFTGITLVNPGDMTTRAVLEAFAEDGHSLAVVEVDIPSRGKYVRLLQFVFGQADPAAIRFIRVQSGQPLLGFELFGTTLGQGLAGLPAFEPWTVPLTKSVAESSARADLPVPGHLSGWGLSETDIRLCWDAPAGTGVARFNVYRETGSGSENVGSSEYRAMTVTGLSARTEYRFQVRSVNALGVESAASPWLAVSTLAAGERDWPWRVFYSALPDEDEFFTGATFTNLGAQDSVVRLQAVDGTGEVLDEADWVVGSMEQVTRRVSELFGGTLPVGTVRMKAAAMDELMGFELFYSTATDAPFRFDGLIGTPGGSRELIFPLVRFDSGWESVFRLANPGDQPVVASIRAFDADGQLLTTLTETIAAGSLLWLDRDSFTVPEHIASLWISADQAITGSIICLAGDLTCMGAYMGLRTEE